MDGTSGVRRCPPGPVLASHPDGFAARPAQAWQEMTSTPANLRPTRHNLPHVVGSPPTYRVTGEDSAVLDHRPLRRGLCAELLPAQKVLSLNAYVRKATQNAERPCAEWITLQAEHHGH